MHRGTTTQSPDGRAQSSLAEGTQTVCSSSSALGTLPFDESSLRSSALGTLPFDESSLRWGALGRALVLDGSGLRPLRADRDRHHRRELRQQSLIGTPERSTYISRDSSGSAN